MRKFEERNFAAPELCVTTKITHETRDAEYSECLLREDLPKDKIGVYVIVPIERLAVDAILDVKGIEMSHSEYKESYIETADCTLRLSNDEIKERFDNPNASEKDKKIAKIICDYQNALKERALDFPEPFSDLVSKKANKKKYANEFEKTLDELLANQPIVDLTTKDKEILPEPVIKSDNKSKSDKIMEKFQDIKSGKFPEFPKFASEASPKTDIIKEKKSESVEDVTKTPNSEIIKQSETTKIETVETAPNRQDTPKNKAPENSNKPVKKENDGFNIDFNLALTADELFNDDEDKVVIPVENDTGVESSDTEKIPDISIEPIKEPEIIEDKPSIEELPKTESDKNETINVFPEISDLDDDDIYKDLFGANSNF